MTEYNEGDLVEVIKGDSRAQGRVFVQNEIPKFAAIGRIFYPRDLERQGYTVTVLEKVKPQPPQGQGLYVDRMGDFWIQGDEGFQLLTSTGDRVDPDTATYAEAQWNYYSPFTKVDV